MRTAATKKSQAASAKRQRDNDESVPGDRRDRTDRGKRQKKTTAELNAKPEKPKQPLNIYVFGANSGGELGLGPAARSGDVPRPRLNPYLSGSAGIVQVSLGAMHGVALTLDNKVLTWGVNDHGALGRDTSWEDGDMKDADSDDGDADSDDGDADSDDGAKLNPIESTPTAVDMTSVSADIDFTQVAAADNATFVLTSTGLVYGWGAFRVSHELHGQLSEPGALTALQSEDGKLAFSSTVEVQSRPALIRSVKNIVKICCGSNHVMALTAGGSVYTWGRGNDGQLGHRFSSRIVDWRKAGLIPRTIFGLKTVTDIGAGANHSFATDRSGAVYGWGFNNAGQTGAVGNYGEDESAYESTLTVLLPARIKDLEGLGRITQITGGNFHSIAVTQAGKCLTWGRLYSFATGHQIDALPPPSVVLDSRQKPSFLRVPTMLKGLAPACVAAASEHSLAVTADHQVYTWGLNLTKQLAQKDDEIEVVTRLNHKSIAGKQIVWAGAGAQYSMLAELAA